MDDPQVAELVATIERTIAERGFYVLKNRLLSLVCGVDSAMHLDDPWTTEFVQAFATKHDWSATLRNGAFRFYPRAGSIPNAVSWLEHEDLLPQALLLRRVGADN